MKSHDDERDSQGNKRAGADVLCVTPLEERVLRMHLGVTTPPTEALGDASGGQEALGHSLSGIEAHVLRRARRPRAALRIVRDPEGG